MTTAEISTAVFGYALLFGILAILVGGLYLMTRDGGEHDERDRDSDCDWCGAGIHLPHR